MKYTKQQISIIGVILIISVAFLKYPPIEQKLLDWWELSTGQYAVQLDTAHGMHEVRIPKTRNLLEHTQILENETREAQNQIETNHDARQRQKSIDQVFTEAWSETVSGYLRTARVNCATWELCRNVQQADFVVTGQVSRRLRQYLDLSEDDQVIIPIGCISKDNIRYLTFENLRSKQYDYLRGESYRLLIKSNAFASVSLSFEKPYRSDPFGTEGLSCMTPFSRLSIVPWEL